MSTIMGRLRGRPSQARNGEYDDMARRARAERSQLEHAVDAAERKMRAMAEAGQSVGQIESRIAAFQADHQKLEERMKSAQPMLGLLESLDARARAVEGTTGEFEQRLRHLARQIAETENASDAVEEVLQNSREAEAKLASAKHHADTLASVEGRLSILSEQMDHFEGHAKSLMSRMGTMESSSSSLASELERMQTWGKRLTTDLGQAQEMASGVQDMLQGLTAANSLAKKSKRELHKLNALSEHVSQKVQALSVTRQALERAEAQALQVNEVAWGIEDRVKKLRDESQWIRATEDGLQKLRTDSLELNEQLTKAVSQKQEFERQSDELLSRIAKSTTKLQEQLDRSHLLREEIGTANDRILGLGAQIRSHQESLDRLAERDEELARAGRNAETALGRIETIHQRMEAIETRARGLSELEQRLADVASLTLKVDRQMESLGAKSLLVESTKERITDLETLYDEIDARFESLQQGREEIESTLLVLSDFRKQSLETKERLKEVTAELGKIDELRHRLARVDELAGQVDRRTQELEPRLELVQGLRERVEDLTELSQQVDARIENQLQKHSELESMRSAQESLGLQLADLSQAATLLRSSLDFDEVSARMGEVERQVEGSEKAMERARALESSLVGSERRMDDVWDGLTRVEQRLDQEGDSVRKLSEDGDRARELHQSWQKELAEAERRRKDWEAHSEGAEAQLREMETACRELERRREKLAGTEQRLAHYEARFEVFEDLIGEVDRKIDSINARQSIVDRIKREMDSVFDVCEKGREDAVEVLEAHREIREARTEIEALVAQTAELDRRFERLESKIASMGDVEIKVDTLNNILNDISVNVEGFRAQKAVIDHVAEKLAQVEFAIRQAELTTQSLQDERRLAMRVKESIRSLRTDGEAEEEADPPDDSQLGLFHGNPDDRREERSATEPPMS